MKATSYLEIVFHVNLKKIVIGVKRKRTLKLSIRERYEEK